MDPQACYQRILDALRSSDAAEEAAAMQDLFEWLNKGGFPPTVIVTDRICDGKFAIAPNGQGTGFVFIKYGPAAKVDKQFDLPVAMSIEVKRSHYDKYSAMAKVRGVTLSEDSLRFFGLSSVEQLACLFVKDRHLNNISMARFDSLTASYNAMRPQSRLTLAEGCCLYKHLLIYVVLGVQPIFVGE